MSKRKTNIQFLTLSAIMAALYVGLDFLAVSISAPLGGSMKISISGLPVLIVAVFAGPIWGGACGFVGALVGQMISYGFTPMTLLWVLPAVVRGVSGGLLFKAFKSSTKPLPIIAMTCISSVLVTLFNTVAKLVDFAVYGAYYPGAPESYVAVLWEVPQRLIAGIITAIILALKLPTIIDAIKKIIK